MKISYKDSQRCRKLDEYINDRSEDEQNDEEDNC